MVNSIRLSSTWTGWCKMYTEKDDWKSLEMCITCVPKSKIIQLTLWVKTDDPKIGSNVNFTFITASALPVRNKQRMDFRIWILMIDVYLLFSKCTQRLLPKCRMLRLEAMGWRDVGCSSGNFHPVTARICVWVATIIHQSQVTHIWWCLSATVQRTKVVIDYPRTYG